MRKLNLSNIGIDELEVYFKENCGTLHVRRHDANSLRQFFSYLYNSNFPDPENGLKPCPVLLAPSVLPPKYPSTCHRHSGKGLFDVSGHVFNELADKCLNLLVRYMENSVDALKHRTHNDL